MYGSKDTSTLFTNSIQLGKSDTQVIFMIPDFNKSIGPNAMTYYFDERRRMMTGHNDAIRSEVINDTEQLREEFRGRGVVPCPECRQDVAWGNIMSHRLETCKEKRV